MPISAARSTILFEAAAGHGNIVLLALAFRFLVVAQECQRASKRPTP